MAKKARKLTAYNLWLDQIEAENPDLYERVTAEYRESIARQIAARGASKPVPVPVDRIAARAGRSLFERKD